MAGKSWKGPSKGSFSERFPPQKSYVGNPIIDDRVGTYVIKMSGSGLKSLSQATDQLYVAFNRVIREDPSMGIYQVNRVGSDYLFITMNYNKRVADFLDSDKFGAAISKKLMGANRISQVIKPLSMAAGEAQLKPYGISEKVIQNWPLVEALFNKQLGGPKRIYRVPEIAKMLTFDNNFDINKEVTETNENILAERESDAYKFVAMTHMVVTSLYMEPLPESNNELNRLTVTTNVSCFNGLASPKYNEKLRDLLKTPSAELPLKKLEFSMNDFTMTAPPVRREAKQSINVLSMEGQLKKETGKLETKEPISEIFNSNVIEGYINYIDKKVHSYILEKYPESTPKQEYETETPYEVDVPQKEIKKYEEGFKGVPAPEPTETLPEYKYRKLLQQQQKTPDIEQKLERPLPLGVIPPKYDERGMPSEQYKKYIKSFSALLDHFNKTGIIEEPPQAPASSPSITTKYKVLGDKMNFASRGIVNDVIVDVEVVPYGDEAKKEIIQVPIKIDWSFIGLSKEADAHPNLLNMIKPEMFDKLFDEYGGDISSMFETPPDMKPENNPLTQRIGTLGLHLGTWRTRLVPSIGKGNEHYIIEIFSIDFKALAQEQQEVDFNPLVSEEEREKLKERREIW
jgi:hypothetical protein